MGLVTCRTCKEKFDKTKLQEGIDWIMPSKNWYYHTKCYNEWKGGNKTQTDDDWVGHIYDFLSRDLKVEYNYHLCEAQRKKFIISNKYTNKGIYFGLKYFYEVKKNKWEKSNGGLGIIPYIYAESTQYWVAQENKQRGIMVAIEKQMKERQERETIKVIKKKHTKIKTKYNLDEI